MKYWQLGWIIFLLGSCTEQTAVHQSAEVIAEAAMEPDLSWDEREHLDSLRIGNWIALVMEEVAAGNLSGTRHFKPDVRIDYAHKKSIDVWWKVEEVPQGKYLRIKTYTKMGGYVYTYQARPTGWERVVYYHWQDDTFDYLGDSLQDLNGDGYTDYWIYGYSSVGCCLRHSYALFCYLPDSQKLEAVGEVLNPTFYPEEGIIRGIDYGFPEEVALYTLKWENYQLEDLEWIAPEWRGGLGGGPIYQTRYVTTAQGRDTLHTQIDSVPAAYRVIKDADVIGY